MFVYFYLRLPSVHSFRGLNVVTGGPPSVFPAFLLIKPFLQAKLPLFKYLIVALINTAFPNLPANENYCIWAKIICFISSNVLCSYSWFLHWDYPLFLNAPQVENPITTTVTFDRKEQSPHCK